MDLWTEDVNGDKWLVNPQLIIANPPRKRGKTKMARRRKTSRRRRQPAGLRRYWAARRGRKAAPRRARRRRAARRNFMSTGMLANPRRRRARRSVARGVRRRYRRNPSSSSVLGGRSLSIMGFSLPPLDAMLFVGAGLVVPPMVSSMIMARLPVEWQSSRAAGYAIKAASVILPAMLVKKFVNPRAGNLMLLGGAASFTIDLLKEFGVLKALGIGAQPFLGFYERMPMRPALGSYPRLTTPAPGGRPSAMISSAPTRLDPATRF